MSASTSSPQPAQSRARAILARLGVFLLDMGPYILLILIIAEIFNLRPNLMSNRFVSVKSDAGLTLVLATVGQATVILSGGIDLSIGGTMSLTNSIAATQMGDSTGSIILWTSIIILIGAAIGIANGLVVTVMRVTPFIATLASWSIINGLALLVLEDPGGQASKPLRDVVESDPLTLPIGERGFAVPNSLITVLVIIFAWFLFKRSRYGIHLYAVGGDENHAYFNGVPVIRTKIMAYTTSGVFAALAGLYRTIEVNKGSPIAGDPFILTSAAAVLIGGIALSGGRGDLVAALAGAFIMLFINDLIFFAGISSFYTPMAQGVMLIFAVFLGVITYRIKLRRAME